MNSNNEMHLFDHGEYLLKLALENPKTYLSGILNHKFNDFLRSKYSKPVISYGVIPDCMKYQHCGDAFVMALLYQGGWNHWYKNEFASNNEPVPAMIICLGKELK